MRGLILAATEVAQRPPLWVAKLLGGMSEKKQGGAADRRAKGGQKSSGKTTKEIDDEFDRHFNLKGGGKQNGQ